MFCLGLRNVFGNGQAQEQLGWRGAIYKLEAIMVPRLPLHSTVSASGVLVVRALQAAGTRFERGVIAQSFASTSPAV